MPEIVNSYTQSMPKVTFIGKKYDDEDRVDGGFGSKWNEWLQNKWFDTLEEAYGGREVSQQLFTDGDAAIGLMRYKEGEPFQYWIGMFAPADAQAPEGYQSVNFDSSEVGICWLQGKEPDIYGKEDRCMARLAEEGFKIGTDDENALWFFERYALSRFTPNEQGELVLDIGFFLE